MRWQKRSWSRSRCMCSPSGCATIRWTGILNALTPWPCRNWHGCSGGKPELWTTAGAPKIRSPGFSRPRWFRRRASATSRPGPTSAGVRTTTDLSPTLRRESKRRFPWAVPWAGRSAPSAAAITAAAVTRRVSTTTVSCAALSCGNPWMPMSFLLWRCPPSGRPE